MKKIQLTEGDIRHLVMESVLHIMEAYAGLSDINGDDALSSLAISKGFNLIGYHNTNKENLTSFYYTDKGIHFGSIAAADDRGVSRDYDDDIPNHTDKYFLKVINPLVVGKDFDWEGENFEYWDPNNETDNEVYGDMDIYTYLRELGFTICDDRGALPMKDILAQRGYDCIIYKNECEGVKGEYSIAMFNPCNIKLACETFDDAGKPIPNEERFNVQTDDVRY